ncbi:MAG: hypothetical protein IKM04_00490 [Clostridia bacterium]|nr:hypothetical protein [Clostridia bacterium]
MYGIERIPDSYEIRTEGENTDAEVRFETGERGLSVYLTAKQTRPIFIMLRWNIKTDEDTLVLGDAWERSYADLGWRNLSSYRFMPWYFLARSGEDTVGYGAKTGCNSFVSFSCDREGIVAWLDVRCGGRGVELGGRELHAATLISRDYGKADPFDALKDFCRRMCDAPLMPPYPVYGGNNWYYAYGRSSAEEILSDARLQAHLSEGLENRPFMVIDDGWQINGCCGPWEPNERFGDMARLASDIKGMDVRPGIWVRFLEDKTKDFGEDMRIDRKGERRYLDPSRPEVLEYISETVRRIKGWGYELLKHDFTTFDMFGYWGRELNGAITKLGDWSFADRSRTSAEIVLGLYRTIREAAGDMIVIGCNTISHLCAGLVELNRIGDDTSGLDWCRTRDFGVNTLAFRLAHHGTFYAADADCVGILGNNIPWHLNVQWLELLAKSGTPLFVSCPDGVLTEGQLEQMKQAYALASKQENTARPLDWMHTDIPSRWLIDGVERRFDWQSGHTPQLIL